jgi:hypothetical protein
MGKRPKIKGRGADIYLGGDAERRSDLRQKEPARAACAKKAQTQDKFEWRSDRESSCFVDGVKRALACHIRASERLANQAIQLQEQSAEWARNSPLAPLFEAHALIARKIVEHAAAAARNLWQIHD